MNSESERVSSEIQFDPALLEQVNAPDPERVAIQFERFVERVRENPELASFCFEDPRRVDRLATLLAGSAFVSDILIRDPELFRTLSEQEADARMRFRASERTAVEMERAVHAALADAESFEDRKLEIRRFHRTELFRIAASDLLGFWDMPAVTRQLSMLADSLIRASLDIAAEATGIVPAGLAIVGMGKLGGRELNYSSDIDLIFVAGSHAMRYSRIGERVIDVLGGITAEGFLYRVDMRLRPWGRSGALVHSVDAYASYLSEHGEAWEKQALLKARVLAGNRVVGQEFAARLAPVIFNQSAEDVRASILKMKSRIELELEKKGQAWGNVKQGRGSIRDVEFAVQYLQIVHGTHFPELLVQSTQEALTLLNEYGILSEDDFRVLSEGYTFLRVVEHHLQLHHNRQTHSIPRDRAGVEQLARRLEFVGPEAADEFVEQYEQHATALHETFSRLVDGNGFDRGPKREQTALPPLVTTMAPAYREVFGDQDIERHALLARRLNDAHPVVSEAKELEDGTWQLTIVGFDFRGELSVISGLLLAYGFDIVDGQIFTDEQTKVKSAGQGPYGQVRRKIVDVFRVRPVSGSVVEGVWKAYADELEALVRALAEHRLEEVQGQLAERVAESRVPPSGSGPPNLYPVDIVIDNETDRRFTVLHIEAPDTVGFLYELTNALSLLGVDIGRVSVASAGERVRDTLYVTNDRGDKITADRDQHQLRLATVLVQHFTHLLPHAPNPTSALLQFRTFLAGLLSRADWVEEIASLERPEVLDVLTRILGVGDFLWNDFLRMQHETLFPVIEDSAGLEQDRSTADLSLELQRRLDAATSHDDRVDALNRFKDEQMFRIDMRYILGQIDEFGRFALEITDLAEIVVDQALRMSIEKVEDTAGKPMFADGGTCPISVCALGKFGGREMGFASDIELLFVYEASGKSSGPVELTNAQYFDQVAREFLSMIRAKREGVFEVDLRLRPYGSTTSLAISLALFSRYFAVDGPAWPYERQLLIKLRPIAGDPALGQHITEIRNEILSGIGMFDAGSMRAMRERQLRHPVTPGTLNAKYSPGGLVDVEYLTQALQISYCNRHPELLNENNTYEALQMLHEQGILDQPDFETLSEALMLLRRVIDGLRMVRGNARDLDVPTPESQEMLYLARRLKAASPSKLAAALLERMASVSSLGSKLLG
jgi:glutamate-ammonia-ligase adenylyltransferase